MKSLRFIMFLFYRYYSKGGTRDIPYASALFAVGFLVFLHIFQIVIILDKVSLLSFFEAKNRFDRYIKIALFMLPIFFIINLLVKERDIKNLTYTKEKIKRGNIYLIIYIVLSFALIFVLMFLFPSK